jgi:hypothetical protein
VSVSLPGEVSGPSFVPAVAITRMTGDTVRALSRLFRFASLIAWVTLLLGSTARPSEAQQTAKPALQGAHWVAITGKPLGATAGAMTFQKGGNAVDAACAMLAATATMWDVLAVGAERPRR